MNITKNPLKNVWYVNIVLMYFRKSEASIKVRYFDDEPRDEPRVSWRALGTVLANAISKEIC